MEMSAVLRRPGIVTVAAGMLAAGGAMFAGEVLLSTNKYFAEMRVYERATIEGIVPNDTAFAAIGIALHLAAAAVGIFAGVALVVLAGFALGGRSWARAVSWIFGIPVLLWYGGLAVLTFLTRVLDSGIDAPQPAELTRRFEQAWPPWLNALDVVLMVLVSAALLVALVCQTVPAADAFFRRARVLSAGH